MPPIPYGFMADINAVLVQQILYFPERKKEPHTHHYRQTDDLGLDLRELKGSRFLIPKRQTGALPTTSQYPLIGTFCQSGSPNRTPTITRQPLEQIIRNKIAPPSTPQNVVRPRAYWPDC